MYKEFHDILYKSMTDKDINLYKTEFWKEEARVFTKDINKTIGFINSECTDEEFTWLGEIFQQIAEQTNSKEFVDAIKTRFTKINPNTDVTGTEDDIACAEHALINK